MSPLTEQFVADVREALDKLYDPSRLGETALATRLLPDVPLGIQRARALRQLILDAIEQLNPDASQPASAHARRAYQVLSLRYVESLPFRDVMAELGLSQTQYHRDQRHAIEVLATVLEERVPPASRPTPVPPSAVSSESGALVNLLDVVRGVVGMLGPLAISRGIALQTELPTRAAPVAGDRTALRQCAISAIGLVVGAIGGGVVSVSASESEGQLNLRISHDGPTTAESLASPDQRSRLQTVVELASFLDGACTVEAQSQSLVVTLKLPIRRRTILVIDDNPDIVQLVTRFVAARDFAVLSAGSVAEGLAMARLVRPGAILLDIMMPGQDGWDALQSLRHDPATLDVPILVCTVLAEKELATALGATAFIRKPLTQTAVLEALERWTIPPSSSAGST